MAKRSPVIEMTSYGIYSTWDSGSKELPQIQDFTTIVPADEHIEFGFIVNIKKAKGERVRYCIYHPGILGKKGRCWNLLMVKSISAVMIGTSIWVTPFSCFTLSMALKAI